MSKQNIKIGLGFVVVNMCIAFYYTYLAQLFDSYGFNSQQIGTLLMIYVLMAVVAMPLMGIITDKYISDKYVLLTVLIISGICSIVYYGVEKTFLNSAIYMAILSFSFKPSVSVIESYTYKLINDGDQIDFGIVRAMGSFGFAIGAYAMGKAIDIRGYDTLYFAQVIGVSLAAIIIIFNYRTVERPKIEKVEIADKTEREHSAMYDLVRNRDYMALIIGGFFVNIAVSLHFTYMPLLLQENGANSSQIGLAFSVMTLTEVPVIAYINRIRRRISATTLITIAGIVYVFRMIVAVNIPTYQVFMLMGLLQSVSLGFLSPTYVHIMNKIVKKENSSTAILTGYSVIYNVSAVLSMAVGGYFMDLYGYQAVLNSGWVMGLIGTLIFVLNFKVIKNPKRRAKI